MTPKKPEPKPEPEPIVKYIGNGAFVLGMPARDMPMSEWQTYPLEMRELVVQYNLYEPPTAAGGE